MLSGFKAFIARGNVLDLAVAVIIGAAFTKIVTSLTEDVIMPLIGKLAGDIDFSGYYILLGTPPASLGANPTYAQLKEANVAMLGYGAFVTTIINFLIVAFFIYLMVSAVKKAMPPEEAKAAADAPDVLILKEIRDELKAQRGLATARTPEAPLDGQ